jgi:hypothetical protein
MTVELDAGRYQFPTVIWVDADKRGDAITLIFGSRVEGQGAALRVTLTLPQCYFPPNTLPTCKRGRLRAVAFSSATDKIRAPSAPPAPSLMI